MNQSFDTRQRQAIADLREGRGGKSAARVLHRHLEEGEALDPEFLWEIIDALERADIPRNAPKGGRPLAMPMYEARALVRRLAFFVSGPAEEQAKTITRAQFETLNPRDRSKRLRAGCVVVEGDLPRISAEARRAVAKQLQSEQPKAQRQSLDLIDAKLKSAMRMIKYEKKKTTP